MERWLNGIWYGGRRVPLILRTLATLYGGVLAVRRLLFRRGWLVASRLACPVIVVGNLTVGGTGKTPLTLWLVERLQGLGLRVGVVLRGFGGSLQRSGALVMSTHTAAEAGDEALLIQRRSGAPVAIGADRVAAAARLIRAGVQVVVADDGLQHLRLARDVEIVVVDGERGFGNGLLLPAGPLREPLTRLQSVSLVVQNGAGAGAGALRIADALRMNVTGSSLQPVAGGEAEALSAWRGRGVHAVAAIGNPRRFFDALRVAGLTVTEHVFPDHHPFVAQDLAFADAQPVLMTEKDAVKCRPFATPRHWFLPVSAEFATTDAQRLLGRIIMDARLLDLLVCPLCKGPLQFDKSAQELICRAERLAYPIRDGVPVMLEEEAKQLPSDDPRLER